MVPPGTDKPGGRRGSNHADARARQPAVRSSALAVPDERPSTRWTSLMPRRGRGLLRLAIGAALAVADCLAIGSVGFLAELVHRSLPGDPGSGIEAVWHVLVFVAAFLIVPTLARGEYSVEAALSGVPLLRRTASLWLAAWTGALIVGFLTKTTGEVSRIGVLVCFVAGLPAVVVARVSPCRWCVATARRGRSRPGASISSVTRPTSRASTPATTPMISGCG